MLSRRNVLTCWLCALTALAISALALPGCGSANKDKAVESKVVADDPFKVPDGTNQELLQFIKQLSERRFKANTDAEIEVEKAHTATAIVAAAEKILASNPTPDEQTAAKRAKLQALGVLVGAATTDDERTAARDAVKKYATALLGEGPVLAKDALRQLLLLQFAEVAVGNEQAAALVAEALQEFLKSANLNATDFQVAARIARGLETIERYDLALAAYDAIGKAFAGETKDARLAEESKETAEAGRRRLGMIGKPLEIEGTMSDGSPVDWTEYRGKVVLVDFWATWCGPCVAEIPNVKMNYAKYHDQGFEVLGVSLDDEIAHVSHFLAENQLPWKTLFSSDKEHQGWSHPLAKKYGITSIPATVLVDKEGKVVTLAARGEKLGQELRRLLVAEAAPLPDKPATTDKPADSTEDKSKADTTAKPAVPAADKPEPAKAESTKPAATEIKPVVEAKPAEVKKVETDADEPKLTGNPYLPSKKLSGADLVEFITLAREKPISVKQRTGFYEGLIVAADRVLAADADQTAKTLAMLAKLEALHAMSLADEKGTNEQIAKLLDLAKDEKDPELAKEVAFQSLEQRTMNSDDLQQDQLVPLLDEIAKYFGEDAPVTRQSRLASGVVHVINRIADDKVAKKQMVRFAPIFRKSKDQSLVRYGRKLGEAAGTEKDKEEGQAID